MGRQRSVDILAGIAPEDRLSCSRQPLCLFLGPIRCPGALCAGRKGFSEDNILVSFEAVRTMATRHGAPAAFLLLRVSRAGLLSHLSAGETCPLRCSPRYRSEPGLPPQISRKKTAPSRQSLKKNSRRSLRVAIVGTVLNDTNMLPSQKWFPSQNAPGHLIGPRKRQRGCREQERCSFGAIPGRISTISCRPMQ